VEITWLGHACTRIRTRGATVLTDPFERSGGLGMGRPTADIVTVSHEDPLHAHVAGVRGQPLVIDGPGEYEVQGVQITGVATSLRPPAKGKPERNTAYLIEAEGLHVAQLGAIGVVPTAEQAELLSNVDVLILPLGEGGLDADDAARTVRALEPSIVVPVSYQADGNAQDEHLRAFLSAVGLEPEESVAKLSLQHRPGEGQKVVLLEPRG